MTIPRNRYLFALYTLWGGIENAWRVLRGRYIHSDGMASTVFYPKRDWEERNR